MSDYISGITEKYSKEILKGRVAIEGNVVSCLFQDPLLIDESDLKPTDFITVDGRFYFCLAQKLREKKFSVFDEVTILSSMNENVIEEFNKRGGYDTIQKLTSVVSLKNYETFVDNLYRENIICHLVDNGFNVLKPVEENGREIIPLNLFRKMPSESVLDWYDVRLNNYGTGYTSRVLEEGDIDYDDDFFEQLDSGEDCGVPFESAGEDINFDDMRVFPFLSQQISGYFDGTFNVLAGHSSVGKSCYWTAITMSMVQNGRKVLIISNEQKIKIFKINFMVWFIYKYFRYYGITKKKLLNAALTDEDKKIREEFKKVWFENYKGKIKFIGIADADMGIVKKKIRQNVLQNSFDVAIYDTLKCDFDTSNNDNTWISLIKDSRELDKLAKKYNIIMLASLQLSMATKGKLFLDGSELSMSKQSIEVMESLILLRSVYNEELDKGNKKYYCNPFRLKKNSEGKWIEEEFEPDPAGTYKMLFVGKGRNGANSNDTGVAYLLAFDGNHGVFKETAKCRPRHGFIGT